MRKTSNPQRLIQHGPPCPACDGGHALRFCDTYAAADMLRSSGEIMSAVEVEKRAARKVSR